jgi:iron complex outermembrane receptor protein
VAVFGRFGTSFRVANVDEIGFVSPGQTLLPQTSRDLELGARWTHAGGRAEVRLYRNALVDEIGFDPNAPGPFGPGANVNFDPTRRRGLEIEVAQALTTTVDLRLNAELRRATLTSGPYDGRDVPLTARHSVAVRAGWAPAPGHRIDAGVHRVGPQSPDFDNGCRMPAYTTADLRYAYRWNMAELALGIDNLADARYYTLAFACVGGAVSSIYPEAGRAVTGSVRLYF